MENWPERRLLRPLHQSHMARRKTNRKIRPRMLATMTPTSCPREREPVEGSAVSVGSVCEELKDVVGMRVEDGGVETLVIKPVVVVVGEDDIEEETVGVAEDVVEIVVIGVEGVAVVDGIAVEVTVVEGAKPVTIVGGYVVPPNVKAGPRGIWKTLSDE